MKYLNKILSTFKFIIFTLLIISSLRSFQLPNDSWKEDLRKMLSEFLSCSSPIDDLSPCNVFLGRAIKRVYGITDFEDSTSKTGFMSANQIAAYVKSDSSWTFLGDCTLQQTLDEAQGQANAKRAVIAVYEEKPNGHVALILPGTLAFSSYWNMKVPNSASFRLNLPKNSYVGGPLSKAFGALKKPEIRIYGRNF